MSFNIPFYIKKEKEILIENQPQLEIEVYTVNPKKENEDGLEERVVIIEIL